MKTDELEQYDRKQNLEFQGVPQTEKENVTQNILDLSEKLEVSLKKDDISIAHRLPQRQRPGRTRSSSIKKHPIIVRFVSRLIRNQVYANRYKAKYIKDFPVEGMDKLNVNENLTKAKKTPLAKKASCKRTELQLLLDE